jgi:hypothetical protein
LVTLLKTNFLILFTERAHPPYQTAISGEAIPYSAEPDRSINSYYNPDIRHYGYKHSLYSVVRSKLHDLSL